ncbi:DUF5723 family protein [uncultured Mediterranea sp.]|uniref:DUF5723 family protein n=1 Tax=uncultured Mediterranea sp. TaxID=1926662 RepID=UPI0027D93D71|nr:DUF5723 family protein [uncultured Mediterranea sp.]
MKIRTLHPILTAAFALAVTGSALAQTQSSRSAYFLEGSTYRHELNPAFIGERGYFSFPALGNLDFGVQSTAGIGSFLYKLPDGRLTTFMHESVSGQEFVDGLPNRFKLGADVNENIFSLGFHAWGGFNTLGISIKSDTRVNMPSELFKFMKLGMASETGSQYIVNGLNMMSTNYAEIAFGHARTINNHLTVGAKLKALVGLAKANVRIDKLTITASQDAWTITPQGAELYASAKGLIVPTKGETGNYQEDDYILDANGNRTDQLKTGTDQQIDYDGVDFDDKNIGPTGFGLALDLGAVYKLGDWQFSAAVLDLGFIGWKNTVKGTMSNDFEFSGFENIAVKDTEGNANSLENQSDALLDDLKDMAKFTKEADGMKRTTALAATLNFGAQYTLPAYDRLNFGLLSTTRLQGKHTWTEARLSANVSPLSGFEASVNYALSNFGSAAGLMLNFHPRGFNFFVAADVPLGKLEPAYCAPIGRAALNVNLGINFTFGPKYKRQYKVTNVQSL